MKKHTECQICGDEFIRKSHRHVNCSNACKREFERQDRAQKSKIKNKTCQVCGVEYRPYTTLQKFCGYECRAENQKSGRKFRWSKEQVEKRKGEGNPAYRNGNYIASNKKAYDRDRLFRKNRVLVLKQVEDTYGYVCCENCGQTAGKVEVHHIVFRSEAPKHKNLHDVKNLLAVCVKCHNWFHAKKDRRNKLIEERSLKDLFTHLK